VAQAEWSIAALLDIEDIANFLDRRSPHNARDFVRRLTTAINDLADFPERGRLVPEMQLYIFAAASAIASGI
jgi:plasmid stabilization system protein ParE